MARVRLPLSFTSYFIACLIVQFPCIYKILTELRVRTMRSVKTGNDLYALFIYGRLGTVGAVVVVGGGEGGGAKVSVLLWFELNQVS